VSGEAADGESVVGQTSGWVLGYSPEYRQFAAEPERLAALAAVGNGRDVTAEGTAVFAHDLRGEATTRPIWPWLVLTAVLLLPLDIAVRRLVITRRDWERAWAATFGRWRPQPERPAEQVEQVARLFQAKERAGVKRPSTSDAPTPPVLKEERMEEGERPLPARPPVEKETPQPAGQPAPGSLAARLLDKKRQQKNSSEQ